MLYLRNGRADWHKLEGMSVDRVLDPHCDIELWPRPWVSRSNFEKVVTQEWDARLTWNERDVSQLNIGPMLRLSTLTSPMTLTSNFQRQILKLLYPRNGRADRHGMKGIWVDGVLCPICDLELWPWPWIFKVKFWKCCIWGMVELIDMETKGCESIGC